MQTTVRVIRWYQGLVLALAAVTAIGICTRRAVAQVPPPPCTPDFKLVERCFPPFDGDPQTWETGPRGEKSAYRQLDPQSIVTRCFVSVPCLPNIHGVDISKHQGGNTTDVYKKLKERGATFAYIRLSVGSRSASDTYEQAYAGNWAKIVDAGLTPGGYHYFYVPQLYTLIPSLPSASSPAMLAELNRQLIPKAREQAEVFVSRLKGVVEDDLRRGRRLQYLPAALDLEDDICRDLKDGKGHVLATAPPTCNRSWRTAFGTDVYTGLIRTWIQTVMNGLRFQPVHLTLYIRANYASSYNLNVASILRDTGLLGNNVLVWIPRYTQRGEDLPRDADFQFLCGTVPNPLARCRVHQYTETALFVPTDTNAGQLQYARNLPKEELRRLAPLDANRFLGTEGDWKNTLVSIAPR